jgi:hypothetical protein
MYSSVLIFFTDKFIQNRKQKNAILANLAIKIMSTDEYNPPPFWLQLVSFGFKDPPPEPLQTVEQTDTVHHSKLLKVYSSVLIIFKDNFIQKANPPSSILPTSNPKPRKPKRPPPALHPFKSRRIVTTSSSTNDNTAASSQKGRTV